MSQLIQYKDDLLIRIAPAYKLEHSKDDGKSWSTIYNSSSIGEILDIGDNGKEILARTSNGLYFSTTEGRTWIKRNESQLCEKKKIYKINNSEIIASAVLIVLAQQGSTSILQRKLDLGYLKAGRIIELLYELDIVGEYNGPRARQVFVKSVEELLSKFFECGLYEYY